MSLTQGHNMNTTPPCVSRQYTKLLFVVLLLSFSISCTSISPSESSILSESAPLELFAPQSLLAPQSLTQHSGGHTENISSNELFEVVLVGQWVYKNGSNYDCKIWGSPWNRSNATIETLVTGTTTSPDKIDPVNSPRLVGIMIDSGSVLMSLGSGFYRLKVSKCNVCSVSWHCRKSN